MNDTDTDADRPPTAADALAIIRREQARTGSRLMPDLTLLYGAWGLAWLLAGLVFHQYLLDTVTGRTAALVGVGLGVAATVVSIVTSVRSGRGVRSADTQTQAMLYGFSWTIAMTAMGVLVALTANALPEQLRGTLIPALFVFLAGVLYLAGGAVWNDGLQYAVGGWTIAVAVVSVAVGRPGNALVLGIGGGGGFLAAAVWHRLKARRT